MYDLLSIKELCLQQPQFDAKPMEVAEAKSWVDLME
jgi:hypothetical protein